MSRHKYVHKQGKMNMPVWKSSLVSGSFKGEHTKFYTLYLAEHWKECIGRTKHVYMSGGIVEKAMKVSSTGLPHYTLSLGSIETDCVISETVL